MTRDERQEIARVKWIKNKCKGCLVMPTGVGKTKTALKCLKSVLKVYPNTRILVVVPTTNLKEQWEEQLLSWEMEFNSEVSVINSVIKHKWQCDILVLDEIHVYNASTYSEVFKCVNYRYILGLTATFERLDGKHVITEKYCPVIDSITTSEALANGWISNYKEYEVIIEVPDIQIYNQYNRQFITNFEFFNFSWPVAISCIGPNSLKNKIELCNKMCPRGTKEDKSAMLKAISYHSVAFMKAVQNRKSFVNNHIKKLDIARKIIEARPNSKILTFSNNIKMAESIDSNPVYTGKDTKKHSIKTMDDFKEGKIKILHSVRKLIAGADIPNLSVGIILGQDSSETRAVQTRGRIIRKEGEKIAEIFNIVIADTIELKWFANSHKMSDYIIVGEEGLDDILKGKSPRLYKKALKKFTFRY